MNINMKIYNKLFGFKKRMKTIDTTFLLTCKSMSTYTILTFISFNIVYSKGIIFNIDQVAALPRLYLRRTANS